MATGGVFPKTTATDIVYTADYNSVQSRISSVKQDFYGVATTSTAVTTGTVITAVQWNALKADIDACIKHQTGSNAIPEIVTKTTGTVIQSTLTNLYDTHATTAVTNELDVYAPTQLALVANTAVSNRNGSINPWNTIIQHVVRVNFASANAATYFFNCGGYFTTNVSSSGGSTSKKDLDWAAIITLFGTRSYTRADWITGGTVILKKTGLSNLHTPIPAYTSYAYSGIMPYSSSYIRASATKDSSSQITFTILLNDAGPEGLVDDNVTLDITSALSYYKSVDAIVSPIPSAITNITTL